MARNKMNPPRRNAFRVTVQDDACMTCGHGVCWSSETPDKAPHKGTMGHVVGECIGGTYRPGNLGSQCWSCNAAGRDTRTYDLTAYLVTPVRTTWLPTLAAAEMTDPRTRDPRTDLADDATRKASRNY